MTVERRIVTIFFFLMVAGVLQMTISNAMRIGPARPDFILSTLAASSITFTLSGGATAGIWAGILMTAVINVNYGSFLVSRALAGTFCGWAAQWIPIQAWQLAVPTIAFISTILAESVYYIMAPAHRGIWWIEHMIFEAIYNSVLSLAVASLLLITGIRRPPKGAFD